MNKLKSAICLLVCLIFTASAPLNFTIDIVKAQREHQWTLHGVDDRERDRYLEWERSITSFANLFTQTHPLLANIPMTYTTFKSYIAAHEFFRSGYNALSSPHLFNIVARIRYGVVNESDSFHDPQLRNLFDQRIADLIEKIPVLEDYELYFKLHEILALVSDIHSVMDIIRTPDNPTHPIRYLQFPFTFRQYNNETFIVTTLAEYDWLLGSRLIKINGVYASDVIDLMACIINLETRYNLPMRTMTYLTCPFALSFFGVIEDKSYVTYTFATEDCEIFEHTSYAMPSHDFFSTELTLISPNTSNNQMLMDDFPELPFFKVFLEEYDSVYFRCRSFSNHTTFSHWTWEEMDNLFSEIVDDIIEAVVENNGIRNLIIDLRGNGGGIVSYGSICLAEFINENRDLFGNIYIIIDGRTASAAVITSAIWVNMIDDVYLIGEPAAQSPNFFYGDNTAVAISNTEFARFVFVVSRFFSNTWPGYPYETLMPDIHIPQTFEDFRDGRDPVLEYIKSRYVN